MAKIIVENREVYKVVKIKSLVFDTEELRLNFVEFEDMSDADIYTYIEDYDGIVDGEHLRNACVHEKEDEKEEVSDIIETGTTVTEM